MRSPGLQSRLTPKHAARFRWESPRWFHRTVGAVGRGPPTRCRTRRTPPSLPRCPEAPSFERVNDETAPPTSTNSGRFFFRKLETRTGSGREDGQARAGRWSCADNIPTNHDRGQGQHSTPESSGLTDKKTINSRAGWVALAFGLAGRALIRPRLALDLLALLWAFRRRQWLR